MRLRKFHQLDSDLTGLDIFYNWSDSPKTPISKTDVSLIYNGKELSDTEVDYIAFGNDVIPCLTPENLCDTFRAMEFSQKSSISLMLSVPTKEMVIDWLKSPEGVKALESMGFERKDKK